MIKLHQFFSFNIIISLLLIFIATTLISYKTFKDLEIEHTKNELLSNIDILNTHINKTVNFKTMVKNIHNNSKLRATIININGTVIAESNGDLEQMDNHKNRVEIREAITHKYGFIIRHSKTLDVDFLYVAKKIQIDDSYIILRLSKKLSIIMNDFYDFWIQLVTLLMMSLIILFLLSNIMHKKIKEQTYILLDNINNIDNKKLHHSNQSWINEFELIKSSISNLSNNLQKKYKENRTINAKLKLKNRQLQDMLSAISHELKNPIAIIMGYAESILDSKNMSLGTKDKFLKKIFNNSKKLSHLIDKMALFTKLENHEYKPSIDSEEFAPFVEDICENMRVKYNRFKIYLNINSSAKVNLDKVLIELVIVNLIDNAIKYSQKDIQVIVDNTKFSVIDNGIGIKKSNIKNIRKKYYRVEKNNWDNSLGLGLALVEYILNIHKSKLEIKSEYGNGSIFSFDLKP